MVTIILSTETVLFYPRGTPDAAAAAAVTSVLPQLLVAVVVTSSRRACPIRLPLKRFIIICCTWRIVVGGPIFALVFSLYGYSIKSNRV